MLIPHHLNPPISGKGYPRIYPIYISGIGYRWQLQKTPPFPGFLGKFSRDYTAKKYPLSRENGNAHAAPLCLRVGAQVRTRPWGGGGGAHFFFIGPPPASKVSQVLGKLGGTPTLFSFLNILGQFSRQGV